MEPLLWGLSRSLQNKEAISHWHNDLKLRDDEPKIKYITETHIKQIEKEN